MEKKEISFILNKEDCEIEIPVNRTLLELIREDLGLIGTKEGCGEGECGACTVLIDGKRANACLTLAVDINGKELLTIEGLAEDSKLHAVQEAFINYGALQCGFCTPGMILSAKALLDENPHPTEEEIRNSLAGNLCRCTGYAKIVQAIKSVS